MISRDPAFNLVAFLRADLARYEQLTGNGDRRGPRSLLTLLSPRFAPIVLCRLAYWSYAWRLAPLAKVFSTINFMVFGIEIAVRCPIGEGVFFPHTHGTVVGASRVGRNATIYHGVTLGAKELDFGYAADRRPIVLDDVVIGSGAKVLGAVTLGNHSRIGANAVVLTPVPDGALAVGTPARCLERQA
jgi:serine O-acetyltransferase